MSEPLSRRLALLITAWTRQIPAAAQRLALLGAPLLGLGLAALTPSSCGAPLEEAGPSRVEGAAGSEPTTAPPSHSVDLRAGRIAVSGALAPDVIRAVLRAEFAGFRACYDRLPQPRPVVVSKLNFTIGAAGNVTASHADSEASPVLGQCLERVLLALRFPVPKAGDVTVGYPVQFGP